MKTQEVRIEVIISLPSGCQLQFPGSKKSQPGLCPPERVREILAGLGGQIEGEAGFREAIKAVVGCKDRRARYLIAKAITYGTICKSKVVQDHRRRIYTVNKEY